MNTKKYLAGQKWGEKIAEKSFNSKNRNKIKSLFVAQKTCKSYAKDKRIKQTRNGEFITNSDRDFYSGAFNGISFVINKKF